MEEKNPHVIEYESLTNPIFLWIMFGFTIVPIILIILKATIIPSLWIILIVSGIIVFPSGVIFLTNGIRLLYGERIKITLLTIIIRITKTIQTRINLRNNH